MAPSNSRKTVAFMVPVLQKLQQHLPGSGVQALIMSLTRDLAIQTLQFIKELGRFTDLCSNLLVCGDSMEDQFEELAQNLDIIIITPDRLMHHLAEVDGMSLCTVEYVVFYEVNSLFGMEFAEQLHKILLKLSKTCQTLLFSATKPKALAEFAKAGLYDPQLMRLDDGISPDLPWACKVVDYLLQRKVFFMLQGILLTGLHNPKALEAFGKISSCEHVLLLISSYIGQHPCTCSSMDKQWSFSSRLPSVPFFWCQFPYLKKGFFSKGLVKHYVPQMAKCLPSHENVLPDLSNKFLDDACLLGNLLEAVGVTLSEPNCIFEMDMDFMVVAAFFMEALPISPLAGEKHGQREDAMNEDTK